MIRKSLLGAALAVTAAASFAGPADDARTHFNAIASGDLQVLMRGYADNAQFNWVGGPLDGTYTSPEAIRGVWSKSARSAPVSWMSCIAPLTRSCVSL